MSFEAGRGAGGVLGALKRGLGVKGEWAVLIWGEFISLGFRAL